MSVASARESDEIKHAIRKVVDGGELSTSESAAAMSAIMEGNASGAQIGALVTALRMRGESVQEIAGFAQAMRTHAIKVEVGDHLGPLLDTCGTGGDSAGTFNISTTASFVIAGAGIRIAKHGNRAASSKCGSADVLEGLGVQIELSPEQVVRCVEDVGIGFMYAPAFHPAMRFVGPARREIGIRTIFNVLGPLTNPAGASHQLIGVGHPEIAPKLAHVLAMLGSKRALLVHAEEGLDELGIAGVSAITDYDARSGKVTSYSVAPEDFGLVRGSREDILGGSVGENVAITRRVLEGEPGPSRAITVLNAGAGIFAANAVESYAEGIALATESIDSGKAYSKLEDLVALTQTMAVRRSQASA